MVWLWTKLPTHWKRDRCHSGHAPIHCDTFSSDCSPSPVMSWTGRMIWIITVQVKYCVRLLRNAASLLTSVWAGWLRRWNRMICGGTGLFVCYLFLDLERDLGSVGRRVFVFIQPAEFCLCVCCGLCKRISCRPWQQLLLWGLQGHACVKWHRKQGRWCVLAGGEKWNTRTHSSFFSSTKFREDEMFAFDFLKVTQVQ